MFCPYCSADLQLLQNEEARCVVMGSLFSVDVTRRPVARFADSSPFKPSAGGVATVQIGKRFCPGCGVPMVPNGNARVFCGSCKQSLDDLVYSITEFNPHLPFPGRPSRSDG
jgi:ribosomal protein S27AE